MTDIPEAVNPRPAARPNYFRACGFTQIDDGIDCPDCDATMSFAKALDTDSDATVTAYRCGNCLAIDFDAQDVESLTALSLRELLTATLEHEPRGQR